MLPFGKPYEERVLSSDQTEQTLFDGLIAARNRNPYKTALVQVERGIRLSYENLYEQVTALASGLSQLGLKKGDRVVVCMPNWPEFVISLYAMSMLGLILVPANPRLRRHEIEFIVQNSGAKAALVAHSDTKDALSHYELFLECQAHVPGLEHVVAVSPGDRSALEKGVSFAHLLEMGRKHRIASAINVKPADVAAIVYTSGTTGVPKGAMLTHQSLLFSANRMNAALENSDRDVVLVVVPACHIFGLSVTLMGVLMGSTVVFMEQFHPEDVFKVVEREKVTVHHGVSTMFVLELNHPNRKHYDLSSLRTGIVAAAPCPYEIVQRIRSELGLNPILSYGMTECSPALTATHFENEPWVYATVGRPLPGVALAVVDENGNFLPPDHVGELVANSPGLMLGYYNNEEATKAAIDERGWFHTGDLASINEAGYVTIVGRIKEMINRGGLKIYPKEVEELLYQLPAVQEAAVVGVPDPVLGERSCACVTLKPGHTLTEEEIREYCRQNLADFKVPDFIEILDEMPLNSSGKIYKLELAKQMREKHPPVYYGRVENSTQ
ncbi:class I adenylate-forming enzyme family protein [Alicyclobacillus acidocaldarius]|uniref:class I adenylate-forming enzyme family protein n=1 Tax=Alicyclobacillus acidocaldarius TaxID=405212 RepID=UPI0002EC74BF|nr:class I adenylate-forming enzyme family protein [Alicyclobacillus acidocaldarius]